MAEEALKVRLFAWRRLKYFPHVSMNFPQLWSSSGHDSFTHFPLICMIVMCVDAGPAHLVGSLIAIFSAFWKV
jgi:hypothetical protein